MQIAALFLSAVLFQAPAVTTGSAQSVTTGSAEVQGTVDPGGQPTTYQVEYGTTTAYGIKTPARDAGSGTAPVPVRVTLTGLSNNTTYHYRVTANDGAVVGEDKTFRTLAPASPPSVSSRAASGVTGDGATLNAGINPRGLATSVYFEYGTSTAYGTRTPTVAIGSGTSTVAVTAPVGGLRPNTRYHFRAVATSAAGVTRTSRRTFTTARVPTGVSITPSTVRPTWATGLTITGTVSGSGTTPVAVEKLDFPYQGQWYQVATATSNSAGRFTLTVPPMFTTARLRVATRTSVVATSGVSTVTVAVKVGLKTKRVSTRRTRVTGTIWPAVPRGRASLQRQTQSGRWIPVTRRNVSALGGDRSRYSFTVTRSRTRAMNYRVVVNPRNGGENASGTSRVINLRRARP